MKLLVLDVIDGNGLYEIEVPQEHSLDVFYENLKCDIFDIASRKIEGKWFDIFCDDCGLFVDNPITSAIVNNQPGLVGNLIFAHHDAEGNTTGLTDEDIALIKRNTVSMVNIQTGNVWEAVSCTI